MSGLLKSGRALLLCAPLLALAACANSNEAVLRAQATADQALATANQALAASAECTKMCEGNFNRGLRK